MFILNPLINYFIGKWAGIPEFAAKEIDFDQKVINKFALCSVIGILVMIGLFMVMLDIFGRDFHDNMTPISYIIFVPIIVNRLYMLIKQIPFIYVLSVVSNHQRTKQTDQNEYYVRNYNTFHNPSSLFCRYK
jgi:hypothetical protein